MISIWFFHLFFLNVFFFDDKMFVCNFLGGVLVTLDRKPWGIKKIQSLTWPFVRRVFLGESPHPKGCGSKTFKQKEPTGAARWRCFSTVGTESRPKAILILLGWDNRQYWNLAEIMFKSKHQHGLQVSLQVRRLRHMQKRLETSLSTLSGT